MYSCFRKKGIFHTQSSPCRIHPMSAHIPSRYPPREIRRNVHASRAILPHAPPQNPIQHIAHAGSTAARASPSEPYTTHSILLAQGLVRRRWGLRMTATSHVRVRNRLAENRRTGRGLSSGDAYEITANGSCTTEVAAFMTETGSWLGGNRAACNGASNGRRSQVRGPGSVQDPKNIHVLGGNGRDRRVGVLASGVSHRCAGVHTVKCRVRRGKDMLTDTTSGG